MKRLRSSFFVLTCLATACGGSPEELVAGWEPATREDAVTIPAKGTASTLDFGCWNIEWFGSTSNGPTNESLQLSNVRDVILGSDLDIWALEEVVSSSQFNSLESQLPGYAGFVANESNVTSGSSYYSSSEQKLAILYKTSVVSVLGAKVILTSNDYDFAGRPPLEVRLQATVNGVTRDVVVIVLHMKAFNDTTSWQRRLNAANALKSYLDNTWPSAQVIVLGDWNDDMDTSITSGKTSPYQNFVSDTTRYFVPTKALSDAKLSTTAGYPDAIDHHVTSNELQARYVAGSVEAYRVDQYISNYSSTTTDHFPVLTRYTW